MEIKYLLMPKYIQTLYYIKKFGKPNPKHDFRLWCDFVYPVKQSYFREAPMIYLHNYFGMPNFTFDFNIYSGI